VTWFEVLLVGAGVGLAGGLLDSVLRKFIAGTRNLGVTMSESPAVVRN
jgi:ABC-type Fe3+-siderophore transport system permease subunit